jgi:hypothetical protein
MKLQTRAQHELARTLAATLPDGTLDAASRTEALSENLVDGITDEQLATAVAQIAQGDGGELLERDRARPKLHSAYSSAALAVNSFVVWFGHERDMVLAGVDGLETLRFEEKLPIGVRGKAPNLDLVASGSDDVVAVESKCTEQLAKHVAEFSKVYDARIAELADGSWRAEYEALKADPRRYTHLDAAQLVKHYLGLRNTHPDRRCTLLYLYWEPANAEAHRELRLHREEVDRFRAAVGGSVVRFEAESYPELWSSWARRTSPAWLAAHVDRLRRRYSVPL